MTEKRALEKSIETWEELKELNKEYPSYNAATLKALYFHNILKNNPKYNIPLNGCYLCEYSRPNCEDCPVKNWNVDRKYGNISRTCVDIFSVYQIINTKNKIERVLELLKETYNDLYNN